MNKSKKLLKNLGILTLSNFSSRIIVFLLVPLYTNTLTTAEYGSYELAVSTVTLLYPILTLNIVDAVMRFLMDRKYNKKNIAIIGLQYILVSIIIFSICLHFIDIGRFIPNVDELKLYVSLYYIAYVFNQFLIQFSKGLEKIKEMGIAGILSTLVSVIANLVFLLVLKKGLLGFFSANILACFVSSIYLALNTKFLDYVKKSKIDINLQKEMLSYSIPLIASVLGWWINSTADKYVVTFYFGVAANGLLSVAYKIPQILNTIQGIFIQAWQISAIGAYKEENVAVFYGSMFEIINLIMSIVCSFLIFLTRPLAYILYAKDFFSAWHFVPFLLVASVLNCASGMLGPILSAKKDTIAMMWSAVIGACINVILNIVLVNKLEIQGATLATLVCSYIIYHIRKRAVGNDIEIREYHNVVFTWGLLCVQAYIECYLKSRVLETGVIILLIIINKNIIRRLLNEVKLLVSAKIGRK